MSSTRAADAGSDGLAGRTAVVTGASRGIGLATARALAGAGARVAMLARGEEVLEARASELGASAVALSCDVGDHPALAEAAARIRELFGGAPDILVSNAGAFDLATVEETSVQRFVATLSVNLVAPFALAHAFVSEMRARASGHIVTIGSIADRVTFPENGAYAASKFGVRALHQVMREELRGTGVRTTLVSPGPVDTPLWDPVDPDQRPGFTPRARMLAADAVADAILFAIRAPQEVNVDELRLSRS